MTGRTVAKHARVYVDGYDLSGSTRAIGPLACTFEEAGAAGFGQEVLSYDASHGNVSIGTLDGIFDNTATSGIHVVMNGAGVKRTVMIPLGIQAAPAAGDPVFVAQVVQQGYYGDPGSNPVAATIPFSPTHVSASNLNYQRPWGVLAHAKGAETGANSAAGLDWAGAAQSTRGGYMCYQVFAGDGTATIKIQDASANNDGSFGDLLTTGVIDCSSVKSGIVALATTATVKQYIRWQLALGTANTVTFALAFIRR